jgi:hypothetical protein
MKSIAYYLPQFHTIPENDKWWGEGFTEWSNVRTAEAMYEGHYQPKEPLDYYDLSEINVMKKQVRLAKKYGLYGFCFHYYWFQEKRLLEKPINNFLKNKSSDLDFPFMLCWANENWTRRWDGKENEVLISQKHSEEDYWKVAEDIFKYIDDDRYIKINNKPLLIIYRPEIMTKFNYFAKVLRLKAFERGLEGIEILSTNSFGFKNRDGFDIDGIVEFPPHFPSGDFVKKSTDINTRSDFNGLIYDYKHCVKKSITYYNEKQMTPKSIDYYPCSFPSWDNTARRGLDSHICANTSKKLFKKWLRGCCDFSKQYNPKEKDFIFINAWNEWAEGAILEPDKKNGLSSLKALNSVMKEYGNFDVQADAINPLMKHQLHEENNNPEINNKINLHYWPGMGGKKNFGDEMSSYIMKKLLPFKEFSYNINPKECKVNLIALGSYIQMAEDDYYIFGSGVRTEGDRSKYKKLNVISVRGPKSRDFLISKGVACPELYGDPGLFISRYYHPTIDFGLKGKIGIVPHITDKTNYNKNNSDKFHIIDPCQHWMKVIDQICSCESIVSSSLHGLICADAYNMPNVWMEYKLLDEGDFKFIDYFLSQGREIKKISSLEDISNDVFYQGGNNINLDKLSEALYSSSLNKKNNKEAVNVSLINPTAITRDNKQYTLYRGEKYLKGKPPPIGFNRSELSYWLECDGVKKQCVFDFGEYSYKTIKRIDIEKKSNKSIIEDLRFIESSIKQTKNGLTCLATCTLLPHVRIYHGTKNKNGEFDKSKGIGLAYTFKMAYCEVNLTHGAIKYKGIISPESQIKNEKNWTSFIHNNNFFVIYSISPLVYSKASSLEEIKFNKNNLPDKLDFHCSTNPINIGVDKFAMLCHTRNQSKDFCYNYQLVTFNILNGEIINMNKYDVNVDPKLYCSSIILDNNKIKVLAGKEDLDNSSFYINIPETKTCI